LALVIGVLMGAGITWALLKNSASQVTERVSHEYESDLAVLEEKLFSRENELSRLNADHARLEAELDEQVRQSTDLKVQASRLQTLLDEARDQADEKMRILRDAKEQMRLDFQNLANEILEDKTHRFAEQNQANIDNLLSPLQKEIGDFRHKVEEAYISDTKDRAVLFNEISRLKELNQQISQDAVNLTKALTRDSKAQGNWGELVLEKILEESGLSRGREFDIVSSGYYDQQEPYQPDVIVHLPDGRDVVIDSKINLSAYQNFRSMEDDGKRQDFLQEHLQVFRRHIRGLREKNFEKIEGVRSLDYVIMFVPVESALLTVIDEDSQLLYDANAQGIMVVSPSNLLLTLRIVKNLWRYEDQN
ncbi:MAG: DNA recombination protein RmuC, partial [SAR324 cluster bacterium]|nr:DNA recombination protein RmuC [SAR324 cluster bacterium]